MNEHSIQAIAGERVIRLERTFLPELQHAMKELSWSEHDGALAGRFPPSGTWGTLRFSEGWLQPSERPKSQEGDVNLMERGDPETHDL